MAVYNGEKYLRESMDSVFEQDFQDYEFIIIDDCSTDNSSKIIHEYKDKRIKYFKNSTNIGQTKSLNRGLRKSCGRYIARIDADDLFLTRKLTKQYKYMELNPGVSACGTASKKIDESGNKIGLRLPPTTNHEICSAMLYRSAMIHVSILIRSKSIKSLGGYDEKYPICADYDLWCRMIINNMKLANLPEVLTCHRQYIGSLGSRTYLDKSVLELTEIMSNYWSKFLNHEIPKSELMEISLIRWPKSDLTPDKMCRAFENITDARRLADVDWHYFDSVSVDTYKLLLWGLRERNQYRRTNKQEVHYLRIYYNLIKDYVRKPSIIIIIVIALLSELIPVKFIHYMKKYFSS
jgi:glycosyltransferase involved in cell wall biosynthesis